CLLVHVVKLVLSSSYMKCFRLLTLWLCWILDAVLTIEPSWSSFFIGVFVTFKCDMNEGEDTDWYYQINKDGREFFSYRPYKDSKLEIISTRDSGEYQCIGDRVSSRDKKISNTVSITVLDQPKAQVTSGMRDIPVGGSVPLTCSVNSSSSSGWKYYWYRDENSSESLTTQDAVFHSNGQISVSQEGLYRCRGGRGNPVYYTEDSHLWKLDGYTITVFNIKVNQILISGPAEGDYTNVTSVIQLEVINKTSECTKCEI
uniref:Ig-like domain-containing protein n=1 Tax=Neolamprologus brichardi TaxID=32507 RepID=A0A3Q4FZD3_NEOBR